jgi:hypothetical protein
MNFPKLALSVGALEAGRRVSPRSRCSPALSEVRVISHKYRGSCVAFLISKSVEPNEELKVG